MNAAIFLPPAAALVLAPLLIGIINRTKAVFAGRRGQPLLQLYADIFKLLRKGAVYSRTTTWVFRAGPVVGLAAVTATLFLVPMGGLAAPWAFRGDLILFIYLLGLMRFFTVIAALDTGSAFEGMGASREVYFAALAEPALLLGLGCLAFAAGDTSLSVMFQTLSGSFWLAYGHALALVAVALGIVLLTENARIPVDDPNTHLELTMIHEVMILDHGGPDLAFIQYGAALKLWAVGALLVGLVIPVHTGRMVIDAAVFLAGMMMLAVLIGIVESTMARLRLLRIPGLLMGALACVVLALVIMLRLK